MDFKAYAESFGAKGFAVESAEALEPTLRAAMDDRRPGGSGHPGRLSR